MQQHHIRQFTPTQPYVVGRHADVDHATEDQHSTNQRGSAVMTFLSEPMSTSQVETNKATIRTLVDAHNRQDASGAAACFASAATNHGRVAGPAGMERVYKSLYATFPDFRWEIQALFGEGDWVALHVIQTGTHLGTPELPAFGGMIHNVAPTGKAVSVPNIHIYEMQDGLIVKHSAVRDDLGMMQQMGLLPDTQHPAGDISRPAR